MAGGNGPKSDVILLTGWRGVGKTTLLQRLVAAAQQAGCNVRGLISPARVETGEKTGIEVEDVYSGARRLLASSKAGELNGTRLGPWTFDGGAVAWGGDLLERTPPCDLFVLDELGPLEFDRRQGWIAGLDMLARADLFRLAVVVVRPEYQETFLQRQPAAETVVIRGVTEVEELAQAITDRYWKEIGWKAK